MAKLTKEVQEDFIKKTNFNLLKTKVDQNETDNKNLETKVNNNDSTTESSINNLKTKVDNIDLTKYVLKSNYDTKIGNLELKIPHVSGLLQVSSFNSKANELENKIRSAEKNPNISNLATIQNVTAVLNKIPDVKGFVKLTDYSTEITNIKNDYVSKTALTSQLNDLKSQHIADEVKKVDNKAKKNITDILNVKTSLEQEKATIDDLKREASFFRGSYCFNQQSYLLFEGKVSSFVKTSGWKSIGIYSNDHNDTYPHLKSVSSFNGPPKLLIKNGRFYVDFNGNYMKQDKISYLNSSVINIYIVYSLDPISTTRNTDFTAQNCLFGAVKITRNRNASNYKYVGYEICFDEGNNFSFGNRIDPKNVIILGCDAKSSSHANNKKKYHCFG